MSVRKCQSPIKGLIIFWLPNRDTERTKCRRTVSEIIPFYCRYINRIKVLCKGEKPPFISSRKPISKREYESAANKRKWNNPIKEGQKYFEYLNCDPDFTYQNVADEFGVSKARASQMIALVRKLPQEIVDYFYMEDNSENLRKITERKLRPLTLLDSDGEKTERFRMIMDINEI